MTKAVRKCIRMQNIQFSHQILNIIPTEDGTPSSLEFLPKVVSNHPSRRGVGPMQHRDIYILSPKRHRFSTLQVYNFDMRQPIRLIFFAQNVAETGRRQDLAREDEHKTTWK